MQRLAGFATDLGQAKGTLIDLFAGVDVLAIESNYCPRMQLASSRTQAMKDRIMGGAGHLSNSQSARAVREIAPRREVVLLHLSRECNTPELASAAHQHPQKVTLSHASVATPVIAVARQEWEVRAMPLASAGPMPRSLWDVASSGDNAKAAS